MGLPTELRYYLNVSHDAVEAVMRAAVAAGLVVHVGRTARGQQRALPSVL